MTLPTLTRCFLGAVALVACMTTAAATASAQEPTAAPSGTDVNANGLPFSVVDQTMGIGVVPKTLPSPTFANVDGIPLSALDQVLGLDG